MVLPPTTKRDKLNYDELATLTDHMQCTSTWSSICLLSNPVPISGYSRIFFTIDTPTTARCVCGGGGGGRAVYMYNPQNLHILSYGS